MNLLAAITLAEVVGWTIVCLTVVLWGAMAAAQNDQDPPLPPP